MKNKITRERLNNHLSYDWIKYICIILGAVLLFSLLLAFGGPKLSDYETFEVIIYAKYRADDAEIDNLNNALKNTMRPDIKATAVTFYSTEVNNDKSVMVTRMQADIGNVFLLSNEGYEKTGMQDSSSYFFDCVDNGYFIALGDFLTAGAELKFVDYKDGLEAWAKKNNNYRTSDKVATLLAEEEERIKEINAACIKLYNMLSKDDHFDENGVIVDEQDQSYRKDLGLYYKQGAQKKRLNENSNITVQGEKLWGINAEYITAENSTLQKLTNLISNGSSDNAYNPLYYALGIRNMADNYFRYESVIAINKFIERYS